MSSFGDFDSLLVDEPHPGVMLRRLESANAAVKEYRFAPGASFPLHRHPHEQITLVLEGAVEMTVGGEVSLLAAGAWSVVRPNIDHGITASAQGARVLALAPRRSYAVFRGD